jgi:hypothetical protein|nr:MAG TPA: hypothetical protein [Caudoviricetes sp.]
MAENNWKAYFERPLAESDPVLDDPIIYKVNEDHFMLTVYSEEGRVSKYWNARVLKDEVGYVRIACPRDKKILHFNWFKWTAYYFIQSGMKELVMMPNLSKLNLTSLAKV